MCVKSPSRHPCDVCDSPEIPEEVTANDQVILGNGHSPEALGDRQTAAPPQQLWFMLPRRRSFQ
eukprot:2952594-Prymnesium_polylepis.1